MSADMFVSLTVFCTVKKLPDEYIYLSAAVYSQRNRCYNNNRSVVISKVSSPGSTYSVSLLALLREDLIVYQL